MTTPIPERTDQELVALIAEKLIVVEVCAPAFWEDDRGLAVWSDHPSTTWFRPHLDTPEGAADRERVMLAMPQGVAVGFYKGSGVVISDGIRNIHVQGQAPTLGRAFIEAVAMYIEAQENQG